jgi:type II secretory pathway pseudopilin PulG
MTLVELLVAFAIVTVLSSLLGPVLKTMTQRAQVSTCSQNLQRIGATPNCT